MPWGQAALNDLRQKKCALLDDLLGEGDRMLTRTVSRLLLVQCADMCLSPDAWDAYPKPVRAAARGLFQAQFLGEAPVDYFDRYVADNIDLFA